MALPKTGSSSYFLSYIWFTHRKITFDGFEIYHFRIRYVGFTLMVNSESNNLCVVKLENDSKHAIQTTPSHTVHHIYLQVKS